MDMMLTTDKPIQLKAMNQLEKAMQQRLKRALEHEEQDRRKKLKNLQKLEI